MAIISIDIPAGVTPRVLDALSGMYNYSATIPDPANPGQTIPNPVTKAQFCKKIIMDFVKENVKAWEAKRDAEAARVAAVAKVETEIVIT